MKTKRIIYFLFIVFGAGMIAFGKLILQKEYAMSIGIVFLMMGLYKTSLASNGKEANEENGPNDMRS